MMGGHFVGKTNTERRCVVYGKSGIKNFWRSSLLLRSQEEELLKGGFSYSAKKYMRDGTNADSHIACVVWKKYFVFEFDAPCFRAYVALKRIPPSAVGVTRGQGGGGRKAAGRKLLLLLIPFLGNKTSGTLGFFFKIYGRQEVGNSCFGLLVKFLIVEYRWHRQKCIYVRRTVLITFWHIPPWKSFQEEKIKKRGNKDFADEENIQKLHLWSLEAENGRRGNLGKKSLQSTVLLLLACLDLFGYRYVHRLPGRDRERKKRKKLRADFCGG